jgi:two-component system KDP operon response regulator KdpE
MVAPRVVHIATDDDERRAALAAGLIDEGFRVLEAPAGDDEEAADLVVIDVTSGALWPEAEALAGDRMILIVDGPSSMRRGFALGAEDCVLATAQPEEVVARCEAVVRRTEQPPEAEAEVEEPAVYVDRRIWVNFDSRQVWVAGRPAQLTPREFLLLRCLIRHGDETLGHGQLLREVWGRPPKSGRPTEVLKQYIWRLRQKVEIDPDRPATIVTEPGKGYRFVRHADE